MRTTPKNLPSCFIASSLKTEVYSLHSEHESGDWLFFLFSKTFACKQPAQRTAVPCRNDHKIGVGLSKRISAVNWTVAQRILIAWVLTIPASAIVAFASYLLLSPFLGK